MEFADLENAVTEGDEPVTVVTAGRGSTREQIKQDLAHAFVIGETRGTALERQPERQQGRGKERTFERGR